MVGIRHAPTLDVHVDGGEVLLIRGSAYESPSVVLQGSVEVKAADACSAKSLQLRLVGTHKLDFHAFHEDEQGQQVVNVVREETAVFEAKWDNLLLSPEGHITRQWKSHEDTTASSREHTPSGSTLQSPAQSYTNLFHLGSSSSGPNSGSASPHFPIGHGSHHHPFKIVLPGDLPETIEGLGAGSVLYRLEATLEKPSSTFRSNVVKHTYLRIFRTMSTDALAMSESMFIGSTWPNKVQYEFSVPLKTIALGATTPVHILLVPLTKGITLGPIKAQVIQQYLLRSTHERGQTFQESQVVLETKMTQHEGTVLMDSTRIESEIKIPRDLKVVTPDCELPADIVKVKHKIKLQISLKNPDGHTSELRSNLPITLFISPNQRLKTRAVELDKYGKIYFVKTPVTLFGDAASRSHTPTTEEPETLPSYEHHVYDQLFTPVGSPDGGATPAMSIPNSGISTPWPIPQVAHSIDAEMDYFSIPRGQSPTMGASPMLTPGDYTHHLREQLQKLSFERMSQVPTYEEALHSETPNSPDLAPQYESEEEEEHGLSLDAPRKERAHRRPSSTGQYHSPLASSPEHPEPPHFPHHAHSFQQQHVHHRSPLRTAASTTDLLRHQPHTHSPLAESKSTNQSTSNLSKLVSLKLLRNHSSANLKK